MEQKTISLEMMKEQAADSKCAVFPLKEKKKQCENLWNSFCFSQNCENIILYHVYREAYKTDFADSGRRLAAYYSC